ncbi:class I tRNA ligase family protein, partial [Candidatus Uhrbacteria bacterium]|nr:class I tRNA ligase family protein [Candidatus Uhrbacteria bacterium]
MTRFHLPSLEEEQLRKWEERDTFRKVMGKEPTRGNFVFFEGPPTANGKPGLHHVLARVFKDVIVRYRTMRGYRVDRKAGWDTHGLPVELEVEKQLGFTKKQDIEAYGIAEFNAKCRESVWTYLDQFRKLTRRIAFWVDLDDPYVTYENGYVESLWWVLKQVWEKGHLDKGYRVAPHCPRCVTSLSSHELAQGYREVEDQTVFVKFPIDPAAKRFFLVWTTTPWTLPGNVALAVGLDIRYVEIRLKSTGERLILAKDRLEVIREDHETVAEMAGRDLLGLPYQALYSTLDGKDNDRDARAYKPYGADFVSTGEGTGIVHIAPAFGEDDARLGEKEELPTLFTADGTGTVTAKVPGHGKFIKDADADIRGDLADRGLLYRSEGYVHSYPFCWRCGTPLMYLAKSSWYIRMSSLRDGLQRHNAGINWVPGHIRDGRFGEWLKDAKDWALSRERYWGTPLPLWQCPQGHLHAVGSLKELEDMAPPANTYYLCRHGQADTNLERTVSSWPEPGEFHLTEEGRGQVRKMAEDLKSRGVDLIYSSDLLRTAETARAIAEATGAEVVFDERLREIGFGEFNGKPIDDYHAALGGVADKFTKSVGGSETLTGVRRRAVEFLTDINFRHQGKRIAVVSHGDVLWMMRTGIEGLTDGQAIAAEYHRKGEWRELSVRNRPYGRDGETDVHRPYVDRVRIACPKCGELMVRTPEVADCWFDSGAMPYAQWHYPFENRERIDRGTNFPADFISEAIDQTRGWFYTLLAVSTVLGKDTPPYRNVICLGHVLDGKGQKMSKSKGNVVNPWEMFDRHGADAIRWHFFTVNQPGESKCFDERALDEVTKRVFLILWNVLSFWRMYAGENPKAAESPKSGDPMDRWILAELGRLSADTARRLEEYDVVGACRGIGEFINGLSTWYVRRSRDRFKSDDPAEREAAVGTLGHVLLRLSRLMAPFTPFLAEALYSEIGGPNESVHLDGWPEEGFDEVADGPVIRQ